MRGVLPLDQESVSAAAEASQRAARTTGLRPLLLLFSPVLGFAIAPWQRRWRNEWGFPAMLATWTSAIIEVVVGAACVMEIIASMGAGASIFPWLPRPLVYFGFYLFVEGLVRLAQVFADTEPVGTFFGLCAAMLEARPPPVREPIPAPTVEVFDEAGGALELLSPILRRDWEHRGLLRYRGGRYVLDSTRRLGESWVYGFLRVEAGDHSSAPNLRLLPPRAKVEAPLRDQAPGVLETVLLSIACTLAPWRFQDRWGWQVGLRPMWFTVMGASAELIGGLSNLGAEGEMGSMALLLNLFFVFEAVARFAFVALKGRGLGSVIGLPLAPILERYLPEPKPL